ncbi:MAG: phosphatase PAP2 family protein [Oscillospiraceae bacterium]|nr:phosphatase PAP2 family protein [Oscillospiraceae bacterium]
MPAVLFVMLVLCIYAGAATRFEGWFYGEAVERMSPVLTAVMKGVTHFGDPAVVILLCLVLFLVPKTRKSIAPPVSAAVILSAVLNVVLKRIFARGRPNVLRLISETGYSFPSGHAMISASLYGMLILLIWKYFRSVPLKVSLSLACAALTALIGFSRVYLGVHYAGDVLGGWLFGAAVSLSVYSFWDGGRFARKGSFRFSAQRRN